MAREILFKGKRADNGKWIRGDLITTPFIRNTTQQNIVYILDVTKAEYDCFEDLTEDNGYFEVYPETVCQYTGLTDKNGRKIFEGDIVKTKFFGKDNGNGQNFADYDIFKIVYKDGIYLLENNRRRFSAQYIPDMMGNGIKVIGNIFDNPELMEEG